ncbi:phosphopyruvate hydratase [Thalassospiraceae bacterium LMO-JJ14]|nr:phosphopyruvate hydratase [Thalassospiraceae bacterium LMO-JJ14]
MAKHNIKNLHARRVWDSRGRPTVEVEVELESGTKGIAIAPAGASRGRFEAVDLRDGGKSFGGWDVTNAVKAVDVEIAEVLKGQDVREQARLDKFMIELDGTPNKKRLGGNATVAASMAIAHAAAAHEGVPLWQYLRGDAGDDKGGDVVLPLPEIQIFGGGAHASRRVDVQDFMVIATGAASFREALDWTAEVYLSAGKIMADAGKLSGVADEGGFWPDFDTNEEALETLVRAIEGAGFTPGNEVSISLDIAASEFGENGKYTLAKDDRTLSSEELCAMLVDWMERYPIVSIEDPLGEDDPDGLMKFTWAVGDNAQVVGDDVFVTNAARVKAAAKDRLCNSLLCKPNQAGTLSEAKAAFDAAAKAGMGRIVSARSGETEDSTIVHMAVGWGAPQLKVGSFARSERMVKWNEGIRIADTLADRDGPLPPKSAFHWR